MHKMKVGLRSKNFKKLLRFLSLKSLAILFLTMIIMMVIF